MEASDVERFDILKTFDRDWIGAVVADGAVSELPKMIQSPALDRAINLQGACVKVR